MDIKYEYSPKMLSNCAAKCLHLYLLETIASCGILESKADVFISLQTGRKKNPPTNLLKLIYLRTRAAVA